MSACTAVFKRELKGYFTTPIAYVFLFIFLFIAGYWPFRNKFFELRQADLHLFFNIMPLLLGAMASCIAMRLWAEEKKSGSIEFLEHGGCCAQWGHRQVHIYPDTKNHRRPGVEPE